MLEQAEAEVSSPRPRSMTTRRGRLNSRCSRGLRPTRLQRACALTHFLRVTSPKSPALAHRRPSATVPARYVGPSPYSSVSRTRREATARSGCDGGGGADGPTDVL